MAREWLAAVALAVLTVAVFAPPLRHAPFIAYDDPLYVTANPHVRTGISWDNTKWAFANGGYAANWHPLTWLSHQLDAQLFGPDDPRGPHGVNVLLHALCAGVLCVTLARLTGAFWPSVVAATLFAVHPLRVESVAWVSERKDLLCALFFLLTIAAYAWYVRLTSWRRYAVVALLTVLALLSKPMAVTLPCVLLLLDFWPLGRWRYEGRRAIRPLVLEKLPLFAIVTAVAVVTMLVQSGGGAVRMSEKYALGNRLANAAVSYVRYVVKTFWPADLAVFYPHPGTWPAGVVIGSAALLVVVTALALWAARRRPYVIVGWLWFLGTLVPVIGLVQVGNQSMADRYTYIPGIGLRVAVVWLVADLVERRRIARGVAIAASAVAVLALAVATRGQLHHWSGGTLSLFRHALAATDPDTNWLAHGYVGSALAERGARPDDLAEAERHFLAARAINPDHPEVHYNLANLLRRLGRADEAIASYRRAVALNPQFAQAWNNLGATYASREDWPGAVESFARAVEADPSYAEARNNLDLARARMRAAPSTSAATAPSPPVP